MDLSYRIKVTWEAKSTLASYLPGQWDVDYCLHPFLFSCTSQNPKHRAKNWKITITFGKDLLGNRLLPSTRENYYWQFIFKCFVQSNCNDTCYYLEMLVSETKCLTEEKALRVKRSTCVWKGMGLEGCHLELFAVTVTAKRREGSPSPLSDVALCFWSCQNVCYKWFHYIDIFN